MKMTLRIFIIAFSLVVSPYMALAANHYIRAGATGSNNGNDWTNAWTAMPSTFVRGDTYYVADGSYSGFSADTSESAAKYITIKKATSSDHGTETSWQNSYGDGVAQFNGTINFFTDNWIFDGVTGTRQTEHGFKITTQSCKSDSKLINIYNGADYITISHIELQHCGMDTGYNQDCIYAVQSTDSGSSYLTFTNCYMHAVNRVHVLCNYVTNSIFEYNFFENRRDNSGSGIHGESMSWNYCGSSANNVIRHNIYKNCSGTGTIVIKDSVQAYFYIYGNLFYFTNTSYHNSDCAICNTSGDTNSNIYVYNNTFANLIGYNAGIRWYNGNNNHTYNNIWYNCANIELRNTYHNFNAFSGSNAYGESNAQTGISAMFFQNINDYDFRLTVPTNPGRNDLGSPYNVDMIGQTRGADGNWDIGAFEYTGAVVNSPPEPPTGLRIITE